MMLVELAQQAGIPPGVINVIHGQHDGETLVINVINVLLSHSENVRKCRVKLHYQQDWRF